MKKTDNAGPATQAAPIKGKTGVNKVEDYLVVDSPLSIHRGLLNTIPSDGIFEIEVGFLCSDALVQLIPITKGGSPCTLDTVKTSVSGSSLRVEYKVSDNSQLLQIAYIAFVTA